MSRKKGNTNSGEHDWIELQTFKRSGPPDPKEVKFVELVRAKSDDDETELGRPFPTKKKFSKTAVRADLSSWMSGSEHAFNNRIRRQLRDKRKKELHAFVDANPEIKKKFRPGLKRNEYNQLKAEALALMATLEAEDSSSSSSMGGVAIKLPYRSSKASTPSSKSSRTSSSASMGGESMGGESMGPTSSPVISREKEDFNNFLSSIKPASSSSGRGIKSRKHGKGTRKHRTRSRKHRTRSRKHGKGTRRNSKNKKRRRTNKKNK